MSIDIFYTKAKNNHNDVHKFLKTLFIIALSKKLKSKFNVDKLKYVVNHWTYPNLFLSASHCKNHIVIAISKKPIGIDLEQNGNYLLNKKMWKRILSKQEYRKYKNNYSKTTLLKLWTKKEAIFKMLGNKYFIPNKINTLDYNVKTFLINKNLFCSIAIHV